jgi:DNA-binding LytR/AlgR family response regulator
VSDTRTPRTNPATAAWDSAGDIARGLLICVLAGSFLAIAGAFGSGAAPLLTRLTYWIGLMFAGSFVGAAIARPVFGAARFADKPWLACVIVAALLTPPLTVIVWVASNAMFHGSWTLESMAGAVAPVAMISIVMTAINYMADHRPRETHAAPAGAAPPKFLERIPMKLRGAALYAVEAEDHYLRIHTDRGSDLILMRLSDAVGELEGIEGAQTHRSWWVARDAIAEVERGDGRATFILRDGARAPVSRTFARTLRAEGWY